MENRNKIVQNLFEKHIKGTEKEAIVENITVFLCHLTFAVSKENNLQPNVYLNTRVLKHVYDKRPAQEFDCIVLYLRNVVRKPDHIYKNKDPKRGDYLFAKIIKNEIYLCSLELCEGGFNVVTVFRLRKGKESYLKSYDSLWSWRNGASSS